MTLQDVKDTFLHPAIDLLVSGSTGAVAFEGSTANNFDVLPVELIRKGRFDEIFFVGLPLEEEKETRDIRQDIEKIDMY